MFVVGGGPSLRGFDFARLRDRRCIAINSGAHDLPWADLLFFRDPEWFERERALVEGFAGMIATVSSSAKAAMPERIHLLRANSRAIPRCRTSGQQCVSLAMVMQASRIVLVGFDWNREGGHYHDRYGDQPELRFMGGLLEAWQGYAARARRAGAVIVNATPGSAITQFERVSLAEELAR